MFTRSPEKYHFQDLSPLINESFQKICNNWANEANYTEENCDDHSIKRIRIGNSGKFVWIESKMWALNSSSGVKVFLVPYEQPDIDQQDYYVVPS